MKTLAFGLLFLASSVIAQPQCTNLIYTGAPFTSLVTSGSNAQPLVPLSGTVILDTALPANAQNLATSPTNWQFNSESPNLNFQYSYELFGSIGQPMPVFYFTTDSKGNITKWSFTVQWYTMSTPEMNMSAMSAVTGDTIEFGLSQPSPVPPQTQTSGIIGSSSSPGSWTCEAPAPVNPLAATVARLQAQVTSLQSQLQWQTYYVAFFYW